jgi:hypothetical protein
MAGNADPLFPTEVPDTKVEATPLPPLRRSLNPPRKRSNKSQRHSKPREFARIPHKILDNPYVAKRLNLFPPRPARPPRCAFPSAQLATKAVEENLDEYTRELFSNPVTAGESEATVEQLRASVTQLRQLERELIDRSRYLDAKRAVSALGKCQLTLKMRQQSEKAQMSMNELTSKKKDLEELIEQEQMEWDERIREHEVRTKEALEKLKSEQEKELKEFDEEVPTDLTPMFKRCSVAYLEMRVNEKNLALSRRFDDAEKLKRKADKLAVAERKANVERQGVCFEERRVRLQKRHELTVKTFLANAKAKKKDLSAARERAVEGHVGRIKLIDKEIRRLQGGEEEEGGA